jgi:CBS domain-containing protein
MQPDPPVVRLETPLPEVLHAVLSTRLNRAIVVDADRRPIGVVTDAELLGRLAATERRGVLRALMDRLPFSTPPGDRAARRRATAQTAANLMTPRVASVQEDAALRDAIAAMLEDNQKVVAVVDPDGRLVGILDRRDLLHGLLRT